MKSVTWEACRRSIRLPSAPPMISASGRPVRQSRRGVRAIHTTSTALIASASTTKNQRCQPPPSDRKLKAAPLLNVSVQFRKPGITACGKPIGCRAFTAHHLLSWSSAMMAAESHSQMIRSEEHTSELQSPVHLVCRLLLEKKKKSHKHLCL